MTITNALITIMATCPATVYQNVSKEPWNAYDYSVYDKALVRCQELDEEQSCIILFRKYNIHQYTVICGAVKDE